jgi:Zn-finger nucleic acid-binding protein
MNCPICNIQLAMADKQGVEIDYCPKCRGVWLDRGELEKLIERSSSYDNSHESGYGRENHDSGYGRDSHSGDYKHNNHKRKSLLSEFFD